MLKLVLFWYHHYGLHEITFIYENLKRLQKSPKSDEKSPDKMIFYYHFMELFLQNWQKDTLNQRTKSKYYKNKKNWNYPWLIGLSFFSLLISLVYPRPQSIFTKLVCLPSFSNSNFQYMEFCARYIYESYLFSPGNKKLLHTK